MKKILYEVDDLVVIKGGNEDGLDGEMGVVVETNYESPEQGTFGFTEVLVRCDSFHEDDEPGGMWFDSKELRKAYKREKIERIIRRLED